MSSSFMIRSLIGQAGRTIRTNSLTPLKPIATLRLYSTGTYLSICAYRNKSGFLPYPKKQPK